MCKQHVIDWSRSSRLLLILILKCNKMHGKKLETLVHSCLGDEASQYFFAIDIQFTIKEFEVLTEFERRDYCYLFVPAVVISLVASDKEVMRCSDNLFTSTLPFPSLRTNFSAFLLRRSNIFS